MSKIRKSKPILKYSARIRQKQRKMEAEAMDFAVLNKKAKEPFATKTGVVYDESMVEHLCLWDSNYPERPERFSMPLQRCRDYGLINRCSFFKSRRATTEELLLQHGQSVIDTVSATSNLTDEEFLEKLSSKYDSVYFHPRTFELALLSVGSTVDLISKVIQQEVKNGMAIIRPPGHHAMFEEPCGYCFFNNVAIAAKHALENLGLSRILIVDWDVHHGQATQYAFYEDPRVLYFSTHRYEHGAFWPNLEESNFDHVGKGRGKGFNINVPLNKTGLGNSEFLAVFHQILLPVAYEFSPELVIVSAGYDAAIGCFEGEMEVTPACYSHLLHSLMALAEGKVCVVLEGGYCLKSLSEGVALTLRTLLGDPCPLIGATLPPDPCMVSTILDVISVLRPYWKSLNLQGNIDEIPKDVDFSDWKRHDPVVKYVGERPIGPFPTRDFYARHTAQRFQELDEKIDTLIDDTDLRVPNSRTCLTYDSKMTKHRNLEDPRHPEKPSRFSTILNKMLEFDLISRCCFLKSRMAIEDEVLLAHTSEYLENLSTTKTADWPKIQELQESFRSIYLCQDSYEAALLAAGCLLQVVDAVLDNQVQNGVAVIRPPGHHAEEDAADGFCLLNNVAIAAKYAIVKKQLERILIIDWDVHHGNGIQHIFEEDDRVLYISIHRYDNSHFFPNSDEADYHYVGIGKGAGFNINIPWNGGSMSDGDYIAAFQNVVLPVAYQFNPQLVLVSAGFDAAKGDSLGGYKLSAECYCHMTHMLSSLANGRLILALEGGYNLEALSTSLAYCTKVLLGDPCPPLPVGTRPSSGAVDVLKKVINVQKKFWSCLQFQADLPKVPTVGAESVDDASLGAVGGTSEDDLAKSFFNLGVTVSDDSEIPNTMYAVIPLSHCPHLSTIGPLPSKGLDAFDACKECGNQSENWVCLTCYEVFGGRHMCGHMIEHNDHMGHVLVLSYADISVWCYGCDAYIDNEIVLPVKQAAYWSKFKEPMPA